MKKKIVLLLPILFCLVGIASAQIPTEGLVGYWSFTGNANDESGSGNNGVVNGASLATDRFENENCAYYFDGVDDFIEVANASSLDFSIENKITISFWVNVSSFPTGMVNDILISKQSGSGGTQSGINIQNTALNLGLLVGSSGDLEGCNVGAIALNEWHHVTLIWNENESKGFVDGTLMSNEYNTTNIGANTESLLFGKPNWTNSNVNNYHGSLDDICIYNRALTDEEITGIFQNGMCTDVELDITAEYYVSNSEFEAISSRIYLDSTEYLTTETGGCDSIVNHYSEFIFDPNVCTETITEYEYISVTDTLFIDVILTGLTPPDNVNTIKVYPNPANEYVIINTNNYSNMTTYSIVIENTLGQVVFENLINETEFQINVNDFGDYGTYFIKIYNSNNELIDTRKLILQ